ncbi:MAG TPA: transketolase [Lachnospiraceae bacterium]|nr:transketolase [Lachnospiraceae bacterium]
MTNLELQKKAVQIRKGIIRSTHAAKAGHPGGSLSSAEVFAYLYFEEMNIDEKNPNKDDRDRFILSKGHSAPGLYAALALRGFFPEEDLITLRHIGSHLQGHPTLGYTPGIDMSSGSLGQGASASCGMAMAARIDKKDYRVYSLLGDGEIQEGQVWEAAMFAGARKLDNLCWIIDNNNLQIDGAIDEINSPYPIGDKFRAFNFNVIEVDDGHDFDKLRAAFDNARNTKGMPSVIVMKTIKGKDVSFMENVVGWHGVAPKDDEAEKALEELDKLEEELCQN